MKKDILYFMHIPWGWVKQRPHFLAQQLYDEFTIDVLILKSFGVKGLTDNSTDLKISLIFQLPFLRFKLVRNLNFKIAKIYLRYFFKISNYKYIWITDLRVYPLLQDLIANEQSLVYDCMDDVLEFLALHKERKKLEAIEKKLFFRSNLILFSSQELQNRKVEKYHLKNNRYELVCNALDKSLLDADMYTKYDAIFCKYQESKYRVLLYIGTISNWFDFDVVKRSLDNFDNIVYFMIGPVEQDVDVLQHDRIKYFGSVEHKYIKSLILKSDILVMPFKVNRLIEAVDPVKLYEYIAFGKQIISVQYDELSKFSKYVNLYSSYIDFEKILYSLLCANSANGVNASFIKLNNWEVRKKKIISLMNNLNKEI